MSTTSGGNGKGTGIDSLIAEITEGSHSDDEQLRAFEHALQDRLKLPALALLHGDRVQLESIRNGGARRGMVAVCRKRNQAVEASVLDLVLPGKSRGAQTIEAYKRWAGLSESGDVAVRAAATAVVEPGSPPDGPLEAVVLKTAEQTARLRILGSDEEVTLRASGSDFHQVAPGEIVSIELSKRWKHRFYAYVSGSVKSARIDAPALGLPPLSNRRTPLLGGGASLPNRTVVEVRPVVGVRAHGEGAQRITHRSHSCGRARVLSQRIRAASRLLSAAC